MTALSVSLRDQARQANNLFGAKNYDQAKTLYEQIFASTKDRLDPYALFTRAGCEINYALILKTDNPSSNYVDFYQRAFMDLNLACSNMNSYGPKSNSAKVNLYKSIGRCFELLETSCAEASIRLE